MANAVAGKPATRHAASGRGQPRRKLRVVWSAVLASAVSLTSGVRDAHAEEAKLCFEPRVILEAVARRMNITLRPEVPLPAVFLASATPLRQFHDAIGAQWRFEPRTVSNAYAIARNEIYLLDDASYYVRYRRTLDDSLAHELVHYLQATYLKEDLASEWVEAEAVAIQTWFREEHAHCGASDRQRSARADLQPG